MAGAVWERCGGTPAVRPGCRQRRSNASLTFVGVFAASAAAASWCLGGGAWISPAAPAAADTATAVAGRSHPVLRRPGCQKTSASKMPRRVIEVPGDMKKGKKVLFENQPYQILEFASYVRGRGSASCRTKMKNLVSGAIIEKAFLSGTRLEEITTSFKSATYSYFDANEDTYNFMDDETYESIGLKSSVVGEMGDWVTEGQTVDLEYYESQVVRFIPKGEIIMEVVKVNHKADSRDSKSCTVELSNGVIKSAPYYIKEGDKVLIDSKNFEIAKRV